MATKKKLVKDLPADKKAKAVKGGTTTTIRTISGAINPIATIGIIAK